MPFEWLGTFTRRGSCNLERGRKGGLLGCNGPMDPHSLASSLLRAKSDVRVSPGDQAALALALSEAVARATAAHPALAKHATSFLARLGEVLADREAVLVEDVQKVRVADLLLAHAAGLRDPHAIAHVEREHVRGADSPL